MHLEVAAAKLSAGLDLDPEMPARTTVVQHRDIGTVWDRALRLTAKPNGIPMSLKHSSDSPNH